MSGLNNEFIENLEKLTIENEYYRRVFYTDSNLQIVLMSLKPREEVGLERHHGTQFIRIEQGRGLAVVFSNQSKVKVYPLSSASSITIPPNTWHNILNENTSQDLKLYTIYAPPQHTPGEMLQRKSDD